MSATQTIQLPPLKIEAMTLSLVGESPLIVHAWSRKVLKQIADKQQKKATAGRAAKDPWQDFCESLYWLDEMPAKPTEKQVQKGRFGFPTIAFKAAAVEACTSIAGMTKIATRQSFHVDGELLEIFGKPPSMREDPVRVGMGAADLRYRGEFWPWRVNPLVRYNANVLSAEQIVNIFQTAGFAVGVGEWRPERDGRNGMFRVATSKDQAS